ncbi:ceramide kinase-like protein isoform X2 [Poeciliopsis prolifica]|uniref:ceramide kinase-like protein isoform X2 n=1 Tax=Poeciliopsis prolifica TaxID=188132 RepID=UPI0024132F4A|nr:ceramide kinase-like protein isoform X2 [Poeciliopsis prolifica]
MSELEAEAQREPRDSSKKKKKKKKEKRRGSEEEEEEQEEQVEKEEEKSESVLMRGIFKVGKKSHDVLLTRTRLTWTPIIPESPTGEGSVVQAGVVLLQDVFAVKVKRRRMAGQQSGGAVLGLALFHSRRRGRRLEEDTLHLHNASAEHTHSWYNTLKELLTGFSSRPRYVKVFINPSSHKKEAVHIYRDHVAPLFKMADIRTDITATPLLFLSLLSADGTISVVPLFLLAAIKHTQPLTDRKGHALSVMKECKLDEYDGVVCVGGDGSVAELCHALVLRAQLDADSPENPVRAALPLGIIPAGSTDVVSCSVHGVRDPLTAALHVVLGHVQQVDMCSFLSNGQLVRFGFSSMFGFGGRSLARAEKKRWMSSSRRREYAVVKTLARLRPEDCQLSFLPAKGSESSFFGQQDQGEELDTESEESWVTNQGLYLSISIMSIPCLSPHAPQGLAPNTSLDNGSASLIAVGNASRSEFIKHLKRYSSSSGQFSFPFVETHSVSAVKVRPRSLIGWSEEESEDEGDSKNTPIIQSEGAALPWNIDGELVEMAHEVLIRWDQLSFRTGTQSTAECMDLFEKHCYVKARSAHPKHRRFLCGCLIRFFKCICFKRIIFTDTLKQSDKQ